MSALPVFDEVLFPLDIALGARGGPERRTEIVTLGSGREQRNARWADARRRYDVGYGLKSLNDLHKVIAFFEERRGSLIGFRFRDRTDFRSGPPLNPVSMLDQLIGTGDGATKTFQLVKTYGTGAMPYVRTVAKPVSATVRIAVNGAAASPMVDGTTGLVTFATAPATGAAITAGFEFDVPVRFDTERIDIDRSAFLAGAIQSIPLVEIRP